MSLVGRLEALYEGDGRAGRVFRVSLFVFDVSTIAYFLLTARAELDARLIAVDLAIGVVVALDLAARATIADSRLRFFLSLPTLADLVLLVSLAAPLLVGGNLGFLRVLRVLRLVRSFRLAAQLDRLVTDISINTRVSVAAANLVAFIFVVASLVWVWERDRSDQVGSFIDALYFTITTLTTTGFGDITLSGEGGRLLMIAIMVLGVGFFLNLIQAIYRPRKVEAPCGTCGLRLHDRDAVHCKHCGETIFIETEGET